VGLVPRLVGLGSVFGKTVRDARVAVLIMGTLLGGIVLAGGATMASTYGTPETRLELAALSQSLPPVLRGLYGNPVNVDTLGGFISWHYGAYFALLAGLWSILALSSTIAGEAVRGSLEFALATPLSRRVIAVEKVAGHLAAVGLVTAIVAVLTWTTGSVFATLPGDDVTPGAAVSFAVGIAARGLIAGSVAFVVAGFLGRGAGAGIAGTVMVAGYVLNSYRSLLPALDLPARLSWFSWTNGHLPLAGQADWPPVLVLLVMTAVLLAGGIEAFARFDVGISGGLPTPGLPRIALGVRGPIGRATGELLPAVLAWAAGLGLYGFVMALSARAFTEQLAASPGLLEAVRNLVPGMDLTTTAGFLQMAFVDFGLVLAGLLAATLVAGWASDELAGRLELILATPLTRLRWAMSGGLAVWLGLAIASGVLAGSVAFGIALAGSDPLGPTVGVAALGAYGLAMAGVGIAVGGLVRPGLAAPAVVAVAVGTFLIDVLSQALRLPDWVRALALSSHMGRPLVGSWDMGGMMVCVALAVGGLLLGAWGVRRRDIAR
jgi:ABC-2 type transport system permease protein